jgi:hypothetical protein
MKYGALPIVIDRDLIVDCKEMLFYQDMPIKLTGETKPKIENRLSCFSNLIGTACCDFIAKNGLDTFVNGYVYFTAKKMYQVHGSSFNRLGYHTDGFGSNDITYIWSDASSTIFNDSDFNVSEDDSLSSKDFDEQALPENDLYYADNTLVRLNQFNVHRVNNDFEGYRTFVKVIFSKDKFDLIGNTHNYELDYEWDMRPRAVARNVPQEMK